MSTPGHSRDVSLNVSRSTGITVFQTTPARLVWTADDQIQVIDTSPMGDQQLVFSARPPEITKASYVAGPSVAEQSYLTLRTGTSKVKVDLGRARPTPHQGESVEQYNQRVAQVGIPPRRWWIDRLATYGVPAKFWSFGKIFVLTFLIAIGTIAAIVLAIALISTF
ncbi:hypothetical protein [Ruania alba]|uniref:Uncharacterized protein n=1 Tax=Ruania alba TaxID=648782 RepID=A0A1H5LYB9_9MICO|nr:hypothetical protein [Ruania alba]SEE81994.1 hypothetical protein SAMN04488554_3047 [Ruania alba]